MHSEYVNQPIELNNVNPEIIKENNIPEHQIIEINHDKERKQETNHESITGLVTDPEIKPGKDSQKPKTINWIYVICFFCFAIVIVICFVCGSKYFLNSKQIIPEDPETNQSQTLQQDQDNTNQQNEKELLIFEISINKKALDLEIKRDGFLETEYYYIVTIYNYLWSYFNIDPQDYKTKKTIVLNKTEIEQYVVLDISQYDQTQQQHYDIYFFQDKKLINIDIWATEEGEKPEPNKTEKEQITTLLNSKITSKEDLEKFVKHFIEVTNNQIEENEGELRGITDFTTFIKTGLKYFPTMDQVQKWDPSQSST